MSFDKEHNATEIDPNLIASHYLVNDVSGAILALSCDAVKSSSRDSVLCGLNKQDDDHTSEAQIEELYCSTFNNNVRAKDLSTADDDVDSKVLAALEKYPSTSASGFLYQQELEIERTKNLKQEQSTNHPFKMLRTFRSRLSAGFFLYLLILIIVAVVAASSLAITSSLCEKRKHSDTLAMQGVKPFETNEELRSAVSRWLEGENGDDTELAATYGHPLGNWDVSSINDFSQLFDACQVQPCADFAYTFNEDISSWNVSNARNMSLMFAGLVMFDCDLSVWDVSSVTDMSGMFSRASSFDGDISLWDVSSVNNMSWMFAGASSFNGDLSTWDVGQVTNMRSMFASALRFEGNGLSNWNVSSVIDMSSMFSGSYAFDQDLTEWDVSNVADMSNTFAVAISFSGDGLSSWNVSSLIDVNSIFRYAYAFNQDLSRWDVSKVLNMRGAFAYAYSFEESLCEWGTRLPEAANTSQAFLESACPESGDPDLLQTTPGPFCCRCA